MFRTFLKGIEIRIKIRRRSATKLRNLTERGLCLLIVLFYTMYWLLAIYYEFIRACAMLGVEIDSFCIINIREKKKKCMRHGR